MLFSILGENHQEVAACGKLNLFAVKRRERSGLYVKLSGLFKIGALADGGADHAQLAAQVSLEAFFVSSVQPAAVLHHIGQQLVGLRRFRSLETGYGFTVCTF